MNAPYPPFSNQSVHSPNTNTSTNEPTTSNSEREVLSINFSLIHNAVDPMVDKYRWKGTILSLNQQPLSQLLIDRIRSSSTSFKLTPPNRMDFELSLDDQRMASFLNFDDRHNRSMNPM